MDSQVQPIFIVGCQRSGTTFLASQLGKQVKGIVTPESRFFSEALEWARTERTAGEQSLAFVERVRKHWRFRIWDIDAEFERVKDVLASYENLADIVARIVQLYADKNEVPYWKFWIDHTPENVRYGLTLSDFFPNAKFVHVVRDGRGVANSVLKLPWGPVTPREAAQWWTQRVGYGLALESALQDQVMRVYYEDLISDPESELQRLRRFIPADGSSREFARDTSFRLPAYTRRQHALVTCAAEQSRVSAWKREMQPDDLFDFERTSFDFLEYLGYRLSGAKAPTRNRLSSRIRSRTRLINQRVRRRIYHLMKHIRARRR